MASLKELRNRIASIKSTAKITSAMKMVSAARFRKAQSLLTESIFYSENLLNSVNRLLLEAKIEAKEKGVPFDYPKLIKGTGKSNIYLLMVFSSDRGLCGAFNMNVARVAMKRIAELKQEGKTVKIICVGKKAAAILKRKYGEDIIDVYEGIARKVIQYREAVTIAYRVLDMYEREEVDFVEVIMNKFLSVANSGIDDSIIMPFKINCLEYSRKNPPSDRVGNAFYDYEPDVETMLQKVLAQLFKMIFFQAILHSQTSEQGARMTSMDNASRNAGDIINKLSLKYNGIRQTAITTELTEIISGAEAL